MPRDRARKRQVEEPPDYGRAKLIVEAMLFSSDRPLEERVLIEAAKLRSRSDLEKVVDELNSEYERGGRSFFLSKFPGGKYMIHLKPEYVSLVRRYSRKPLLSSGLLRTLSFIAYHQPIQQSVVAAVRGGRSYKHISELIERGLIEAERKGRTRILRTTRLFADYIGVEDSPSAIKRRIQELMEAERPPGEESGGEAG